MNNLKLFFSLLSLTLAIHTKAQQFTYDFATGYDEWTGDFADYPTSDSIFYELTFTRTNLPEPLNTEKHALRINGNNHSDDLFMFIKRKITGLLPNTSYQLLIDVELASKAPTNAVGVGGSPGESVIVKAGASLLEPLKVDSGGYFRMNINKGHQANSGVDMIEIGNVGVSDTTVDFTLIKRSNAARLFVIKTDERGEVWVCIGTDSGFESTTTLYYNTIALTFSTLSGLPDQHPDQRITLYPNPSDDIVYVKVAGDLVGQTYRICNQSGQHMLSGSLSSEVTTIHVQMLPEGLYFLKVGEQEREAIKIIRQKKNE